MSEAMRRAPRARPALGLALLACALAGRVDAAPARARAAHAAAVPAPAAAPGRDLWHEARGLADRGRPDSALALLRPAIARDTTAFGLRWLEAGVLGETGDHAGAVRAYERLGAAFPARASELRDDLAAERLAAGDAAGAARDYRAALAARPGDFGTRAKLARALARSDSLRAAFALYDSLHHERPDDTAIALDRARVLRWLDRHGDAAAAYRAVLAREPRNADAQLGLALVENATGRHRSATRRLAPLAAQPDADPEIARTLALARWWDDDPDGALEALTRGLRTAPADSEALRLERRIRREQRGTVEVGLGRADDSDGLHLSAPWVEVRWPLAPRATGLVGWRNAEAKDAAGTTTAMTLRAGARYRFSPAWSAYAIGSHVTWDRGPGTVPGGEAGIVARPLDRLRLEVVTAREPVETRRSLDLGVSLLQWIAAADLAAWPRLTLHADGRAGSYSDGNRSERTGASARVEAWSGRRAELSLGIGIEQLNVHQDLDHGYYDPDFHREWGPSARLQWRAERRWTLTGNAQVGRQQDKGGRSEPWYGLSGRAEWTPDDDWSVALEAGRGDSNLRTASGYRRNWWQLAVARAF